VGPGGAGRRCSERHRGEAGACMGNRWILVWTARVAARAASVCPPRERVHCSGRTRWRRRWIFPSLCGAVEAARPAFYAADDQPRCGKRRSRWHAGGLGCRAYPVGAPVLTPVARASMSQRRTPRMHVFIRAAGSLSWRGGDPVGVQLGAAGAAEGVANASARDVLKRRSRRGMLGRR
jgi:hypothetical protein